jgi:hypothetical protein
MLGPPKPRRLDEPIAVSLEELVPTDNFYRSLEAKMAGLSFDETTANPVGPPRPSSANHLIVDFTGVQV